MLRSDRIDSFEMEKRILSAAKLRMVGVRNSRLIHLSGDPYEMGYQQGVLLRKEVRDNLGFLYEQSAKMLRYPEFLDETYERIRPFIKDEYVEELHGLAHGSKLPLRTIHAIHALPSLSEWGGRKKIGEVIKSMIKGNFGTSCSNFAAMSGATADREMYVVRILDWGLHRISRLHKYPIVTIYHPKNGYASANIGWVGFIGAVSGMNEKGITLGEMGYGDPSNETMRGTPMVFLLRDVLTYAANLDDARRIIRDSPGSCSYVFLISDGKTGEAELYVRDAERFLVFRAGDDIKDKKEHLPPIEDVLYGGHFNELMTELLSKSRGSITLKEIQESLIPPMVMKSNFQNVIYKPRTLQFWVNNAASKRVSARNQPYTFIDFGEELKNFSRK